MRAIFFGTPAIAVPSLEALAEVAEVAAVVCQPDKPSGRGLQTSAPPVKERALAMGLAVAQPVKIRTPEFLAWVTEQEADFALVIAYGRILPKAILDAPKHGCLNLHASILPRYRGAAPITWSIVRGETETGIALMQMDEGMDTGPVYSTHRTPIGPDVTADDLAITLGALAAQVVKSDVPRVLAGELSAVPQDHDAATMAPILNKEDGRIPWEKAAGDVYNHVRGMTSWPGAFTSLAGKTFKIIEARRGRDGEAASSCGAPGEVIAAGKQGIEVACGTGTLMIHKGQVEGRKVLGAAELVGGRALAKGSLFGR